MIKRTFDIVARIEQGNIPYCFQVVQNDKDVYVLHIRITEGDKEIDYTQVSDATITFALANGAVVQSDPERLAISSGDITYEMGTTEISCPGKVTASIQLFGEDGERLTTARFQFEVVADLISPKAVQSESHFPLLQQLVADVEQLKQDIVNLQIPDGSIMDVKLSDAAGQIKQRLQQLVADVEQLEQDIVDPQIPDGSIMDVKLSDAAGQIKQRFASHMAENATDTQKGHIILASSSETELGTEATKAVTPAGLKEVLDKRPSLIDNRIPVPSGADMNDYITPGNYRILDMATAATLLNYPTSYGGTLEVWRYTSVFFIQRLITSTTGVFYQRTCVNGVWSSWNMTYNTTNITVSTSAPSSALAEGFQHQVY